MYSEEDKIYIKNIILYLYMYSEDKIYIILYLHMYSEEDKIYIKTKITVTVVQ